MDDLKIRIETRHSFLNKAKELLRKGDRNGFEYFSELAEREQDGIERVEAWFPDGD